MKPLNCCQFQPGTKTGHYESFFLRANHPSRPQAFWIRYTLFCPQNAPDKTIGEIWAIYFDAEKDKVIAVQEDIPFKQCRIGDGPVSLRLEENVLTPGTLRGSAQRNQQRIDWDLQYNTNNDELLLLPDNLYRTRLPKAKSLVTSPNCQFTGSLNVNGERLVINQWQGSENHNWGSKHTDEYAWGQVAGFDNAPDAFLECSTARIKLGPFWSPWLSLAVLQLNGKRYAFNSIKQALAAQGHYENFTWHLKTKSPEGKLEISLSAPRSHFAGLIYKNPPGGTHTCLNSKIAHCELQLTTADGERYDLQTENRAAFEILTDSDNHGVKIHNR